MVDTGPSPPGVMRQQHYTCAMTLDSTHLFRRSSIFGLAPETIFSYKSTSFKTKVRQINGRWSIEGDTLHKIDPLR